VGVHLLYVDAISSKSFRIYGHTECVLLSMRLLADEMKKQVKKKSTTTMEKTTEWVLGQPLVFPTKLKSNEANRVGRELVDPAIGEPLTNATRRSNRRR